jgi:hypothetical protein
MDVGKPLENETQITENHSGPAVVTDGGPLWFRGSREG